MMPLAALPMPRLGLRGLGLAGIAGPLLLSPGAASANPVLTGAVILTALLLFGQFVLARWKMLILTAPVWMVLLAQADHRAPVPQPEPPVSVAAEVSPRPLARPWG